MMMIVEFKYGLMEKGQVDGVNVWLMEMFQVFGFVDMVKCEVYWVNQIIFWKFDFVNIGYIMCVGIVQDVVDDQFEMLYIIVNQVCIYQLFFDVMKKFLIWLELYYGLWVVDLMVDIGMDDYLVIVMLECV